MGAHNFLLNQGLRKVSPFYQFVLSPIGNIQDHIIPFEAKTQYKLSMENKFLSLRTPDRPIDGLFFHQEITDFLAILQDATAALELKTKSLEETEVPDKFIFVQFLINPRNLLTLHKLCQSLPASPRTPLLLLCLLAFRRCQRIRQFLPKIRILQFPFLLNLWHNHNMMSPPSRLLRF